MYRQPKPPSADVEEEPDHFHVDFSSFETMSKSKSLVEIVPNVLYWISNNRPLAYYQVDGCYIYDTDHVS